jgi:hypothetical protein
MSLSQCDNCRSRSDAVGHSLPKLPAPVPSNVRYAPNTDQSIAAQGLVAMGQERSLYHSILIGQRELFSSDFAPIKAKPMRNAAGISGPCFHASRRRKLCNRKN